MKLLTVFGTRPEAVKLAPVLLALKSRPEIRSIACSSGQHAAPVAPILSFFGLRADIELDLGAPDQALNDLVGRAIQSVDKVLRDEMPDRVVVQGDTATAYAAARAADHRQIPVSHVEAGLRTYDPRHPWPEENYRRSIDHIADQLFAPTAMAASNLAAERLHGRIHVTGNSGIDALEIVRARLRADPVLRHGIEAALPAASPGRSSILVTTHRRENWGAGLRNICMALREVAACGAAEILFPIHPNPALGAAVRELLQGAPGIQLVPSLSFPALVLAMERADLILTDSGGIQEEAPSLGKPVLILRETTERPEGVEAGCARLVGLETHRIVAESLAALERSARSHTAPANPYGDGRAAERIVAGLMGEEFEPLAPHIAAPAMPVLVTAG